MKRYTAVPGIVSLILASVGGLYAQSSLSGQPGNEQLETVSGEIVSSTSGSLVINTITGKQRTFTVDDETDAPDELSEDARVTVQYRELENGVLHAVAITLTSGSDELQSTGQQPPDTASPLPLAFLVWIAAVGGGLRLRFSSSRR